MHPLAAKRQQWRGPAGRQPAQGVIAFVQPWTEREAKECIGNRNRRYAGAERQPPDREVLRAACHHAAPEEAPQKVSWGG